MALKALKSNHLASLGLKGLTLMFANDAYSGPVHSFTDQGCSVTRTRQRNAVPVIF